MNSDAETLIETLHRAHLDNAQACYQSLKSGNSHIISPATNLVFELFLFNSLYSVDWQETASDRKLIELPRDAREREKQQKFTAFCFREIARRNHSILSDAFAPLSGHLVGSKDWMEVEPDVRISRKRGREFFSNIEQLASLAINGETDELETIRRIVDQCVDYVYLVRNNIFHGQKRFGEINDVHHIQRLAIYDLFVRCLNSLFFLAVGKHEYGSFYAQYPIQISGSHSDVSLTINDITKLVFNSNLLRPSDSLLYSKIAQLSALKPKSNAAKGVLVYPQSQKDFVLPLIIGLPHCDEFYFLDNNWADGRRDFAAVKNFVKKLARRTADVDLISDDAGAVIEFFSLGQLRKVFLRPEEDFERVLSTRSIRLYFNRGGRFSRESGNDRGNGLLLSNMISSIDASGLVAITDYDFSGVASQRILSKDQVSVPFDMKASTYFVLNYKA